MSVPYPRYRTISVDRLEEVPSHWSALPLKYLVRIRSGGTPSKDKTEFWNGEVPWVSARDLKSEVVGDSTHHITELALASGVAELVDAGSVLVLVRGMTLAHSFPVCLTAVPLAINQDLKALSSGDALSNIYLAWLLRGMSDECLSRVDEAAHGTKALRMEAWTSMVLPLPPLTEQRAIAAFLDRETGKIDALVEEQRRLIALLKEKRQAVISHAVTKGLDPDAPMKPSGIDWLGEIPAHWTLARLKHDLAFLTSGSRGWASHYAEEGALFIRIGNLTREALDLNLEDIQRVAVPVGSEGERTRVQGGDLLFSITAYLGSVAVVPDDLETAYVSQHVALARLRRDRLAPEWAALVTLSDVGKSYLAAQGYGGTKIQLALDDVANVTMPMPPLDEQRTIVRFLDQERCRISSLISEAEAGIDLLRERRAALISAAVTGKIDVREEAAKATEAA